MAEFRVLGFFVVVAGLAVHSALAADCGPCDVSECPPPNDCLAGLVKDACGCCFVCARREGERCDHRSLKLPENFSYGRCGDQLECRLREDLKDKDAPEAICYCKQNDVVCGSNGKTYYNMCQLMEDAYRKRDGLKVNTRGPCRSVPWIVSGPDDVTQKKGSNVALSCEAMGFPIPSIEWHITGSDGVTVAMPSDDQHVAVQARGGPEQFEITGWLQLLDINEHNDGTYYCVAKNSEGEIRASARVIVEMDDYSNETEDN
uniref:Insulin-like growth factor-binding protein-related protein 1 n=1 Tax=Strigamia maritima TaxID=126957 RepID=T1IJ70_STRMM